MASTTSCKLASVLSLAAVVLLLVCLVEQCACKPFEAGDSVAAAGGDKQPSSYDHIEVARQLWNGAKKLQRRMRPRRNVVSGPYNSNPPPTGNSPPSSTSPTDLAANLNATPFILEMYRNLSSNRSKKPKVTEANTIRSLETSATIVPKCNEFNFSISTINASEFILNTELRLYMREPKPFGNQGSYFVVIKKLQKDSASGGRFQIITSKEIVPAYTQAGWQKFRVEHAIEDWVHRGETHAAFAVHIYSSIQAYQKQEGELDCSGSPLDFVYTKTNEEQQPLLVVYSFDPEVDKLTYGSILERLGENPTNVVRAEERRRRRAVNGLNSRPPSCSLFPLNVTASDIPPKRRGDVVLYPTHYDAGICGGQCLSRFPSTQDLKHAQLVHLLLNRGTFASRHESYDFIQCCAPIRYGPLDVLVQPAPSPENQRAVYINIINNMRILECECLDIIDFSPSRRR